MADLSSWLPFYPDRPPRRRQVIAPYLASEPPYSTAIFPIPDLLASLTFFPRYPDLVPKHRPPPAPVVTAPIFPAAIFPLSWLPIYPPRMPSPSSRTWRVSGEAAAAPPGAQVVIAQRLAWLPTIALPPRHPHVPLEGSAFAGAPALIARPIPCLGVAGDLATSPQILPETETCTTPRLTQEGLGTPTILGETVC